MDPKRIGCRTAVATLIALGSFQVGIAAPAETGFKFVVIREAGQPSHPPIAVRQPKEFVYQGVHIPRGPAGGCASLLCPGMTVIGSGG